MRLKVERKTHYGRILWSKNLVNCAWQVSISKVSGLLTPPTQYRGRCHHCFYGPVARPILIYSQETGPRLVYQLTRLQDTAAVKIHEVAGCPGRTGLAGPQAPESLPLLYFCCVQEL